MPNWDMKDWHTGKKMTLLQAFGVSNEKFHLPQLMPVLTSHAAGVQRPLEVSSGGKQPVRFPPPNVPRKGPLQQYARQLLRQHGWANQFDSFNSLEMSEAGWNPLIANPTSGAYGMAQALNHGNGSVTQGSHSNMYGGFGLTDKQAKAANSGDGYWQLVWMMNYIQSTYGSPQNAWAFHQSHNWY